MLTDISVKCWLICRPIHQLSVGQYVDQYISVEGCTKYTQSLNSYVEHTYKLSQNFEQQ